MNIAMIPDAVLAAARQTDANTAEALRAAQEAAASLVALKGSSIFGVSPAGKSTDAVFSSASSVIDELITEVDTAITVLNQNLHASVDAVVKGQEVAHVDYSKLTRDNSTTLDTIDSTGIRPTDATYVAPARGGSSSDGSGAGGTSAGSGPASSDGSGAGGTSSGSA